MIQTTMASEHRTLDRLETCPAPPQCGAGVSPASSGSVSLPPPAIICGVAYNRRPIGRLSSLMTDHCPCAITGLGISWRALQTRAKPCQRVPKRDKTCHCPARQPMNLNAAVETLTRLGTGRGDWVDLPPPHAIFGKEMVKKW